jgi:hypothetical protein
MIAGAETGLPHVELEDVPLLRLSGDVDSNSPATWDQVSGRITLFVMTTFAGRGPTSGAAHRRGALGVSRDFIRFSK